MPGGTRASEPKRSSYTIYYDFVIMTRSMMSDNIITLNTPLETRGIGGPPRLVPRLAATSIHMCQFILNILNTW